MSKEMLRTVLGTKEASTMGVLRGSLKRALGATAGATAAVPTLEAMGMSQSNPIFWGLVTGAGVLGHDLAGAAGKGYSKHLQKVSCARRDKKILLQKLSKYSTGRKKRAAMVKEGPYKKEYSHTKKASLSRAAKGAIVAPLGIMGAAAIAPSHLFGDIGSAIVKAGGGGKLADPTALQKITEVLAGTGSRMAFNPHLSTDTAMLLGTAGISGLGAGAGKLSERYIPVAKKSIMDNPTARKAALAAALFPWSLAIGGGAYLLGKNNSDS